MKKPKVMPGEMLVALSGGKDSLAAMDMCVRQFRRVEAFFMYRVKGLSFQESMLTWIERRYGIKVLRLPHSELIRLSNEQSLNYFRPGREPTRLLRLRDIEDYARRHFGIQWIASGEKECDSMQRRGMLVTRGPWDEKRLHYYPIQTWSHTQVFNYLAMRKIPLPAEYGYGARQSLGRFRGTELELMYRYFPKDYEKVLRVFPFVEAIRRRQELYGKNTSQSTPEVPDGEYQSEAVSGSALQSEADRREREEETAE